MTFPPSRKSETSQRPPPRLAEPHGGGALIQRWIPGIPPDLDVRERLRLRAHQLSDALLIASGAFTPLTGFLGRRDYYCVTETMRLDSGTLWPMPVTLTIPVEEPASRLAEGALVLQNSAGEEIGWMEVQERYEIDPVSEARSVYGTDDPRHPGVARVLTGGRVNLAGPVWMVRHALPPPFRTYPSEPVETRSLFAKLGWRTVVAFQTRNPIHRAHEYIQKCALEIVDGLFLHPLIGETAPDDVPAEVRMRCYEALLDNYYPAGRTLMGVYPAAMRYAGPREALFHALARKNYGCTHFIVGRDHAGVSGFYEPYAAQEIFRGIAWSELGIVPLFFENTFWCRSCGHMASEKTCPHPQGRHVFLSGTEVREKLRAGEELPSEFTRWEVAQILTRHYRRPTEPVEIPPLRAAALGPSDEQSGGASSSRLVHRNAETYTEPQAPAFVLWLTGLSGAGKTTVSIVVAEWLRKRGLRLEVLDGDVVRANLSPELGFDKQDRDLNIRRIAYVSHLLVRNGVNVLVAAISPYRSERELARSIIGGGRFIEVFVDCPLEVCIERDEKGLYARALAGQIEHFTGVSDPYEPPLAPDVILPTNRETPQHSAARVLTYLEQENWLPRRGGAEQRIDGSVQ